MNVSKIFMKQTNNPHLSTLHLNLLKRETQKTCYHNVKCFFIYFLFFYSLSLLNTWNMEVTCAIVMLYKIFATLLIWNCFSITWIDTNKICSILFISNKSIRNTPATCFLQIDFLNRIVHSMEGEIKIEVKLTTIN